MNRIGQIFGTRKILKNECVDKDWIDAEMPIPKTKEAKSKYVLAQCLNCGSIKPTILKNLIQHPPKGVVFVQIYIILLILKVILIHGLYILMNLLLLLIFLLEKKFVLYI